MTSETSRVLDILSFWHKIEFFIPFDLDDRLREREDRKSFLRRRKDPADIVFLHPPQGKVVSGYTLYFGVFDKSDVQDIVRRTVPQDALQNIDEQQRADLDGRTCIASLRLDASARPLFESAEVSTLPWAVGRVRTCGLEALTSDAFAQARRRLGDEIRNFEMQRQPVQPGVDGRLRPAEIGALAKLFRDWAAFYPDETHPEVALEVAFKDAPKKAQAEPPPRDSDEAEDDEDGIDDEYQIGILNSFYIDDIEMVMADVAAGRLPETLRGFLIPVAEAERLDLYTADGRSQITTTLEPARMNRGRWPGDPEKAMSLMQQFAINTAKERLSVAGLASVNGPPGTGKTTLLRDIIADNIVARARVLAGLSCAQDAFTTETITVSSGNGPITLSGMIPELTGYEMVVASSNNAAVENLSRDLPKRGSIGEETDFGYLQRVAHKVAAQRNNGHCRALTGDEMPWGLIACTLGRRANRRAFASRCFGTKIDPQARKTWAGDKRPLTLWEWRYESRAGSFAEAACAFRSADKEVEAFIAQLTQFCDLHRQVIGQTAESFCAEAERSLEQTQQAAATAKDALKVGQDELEAGRIALTALREQERLLDRRAPAWWQMKLGMGAARDHRALVRANADAQILKAHEIAKLQRKLSGLEPAAECAQQAAQSAETQLLAKKQNWTKLTEAHGIFVDRFGAIGPPADLDELEADGF